MDPAPETGARAPRLGDDALEGLATALGDLYNQLYGCAAVDGRVSLTTNLLVWIFQDGLTSADLEMIRRGQDTQLARFRDQFFDVAAEQLKAVVSGLTGMGVTYSFFGFEPRMRTTHGVFVLDFAGAGVEQERPRSL